ncbi:PepSY domain-containing protein [Methylocella tundrae]|uniref:Peptidase M4 n=1 Tax=Methylocella tundrae TaxID=227605 RepID=A0A4U8YZT7_METTU|nr:PepSY domain-containing protein [Methylocella tundrae]WPP05231.1 PepSY domain-containing protein [Methylocella tundrae]VFU07575.1 Peptidase M4 [Methylocella tundrae]
MIINILRRGGLGCAALSLVALVSSPAFAYTGEKLAGEAKVTIDQARAIALKAHPGKITDEELERESGGTGLRYSFDIKSGGIVQEVGVDAKTGQLLENAKEGPHPD